MANKRDKENDDDKVKIYDKDMYISQEKLRTIVIIIIIFVIGFVTGYFSNNLIKEEKERIDTDNSISTESEANSI